MHCPSRIGGRPGYDEGRISFGCLFSLILLALAVFVAAKVAPPYIAYKDFESDMKSEVSRAGAHIYDDEVVAKEVVSLAEKNNIRLSREDVKVERFAGQIEITLHYAVPVDLIVYQHDMEFDIKVSSFVGRL